MKFHIAHIIPHPRMHGLNGYREVIDSIIWGLGQLGHEVTYSINEFSSSARNIVFGAQMLSPHDQSNLKDDTIIYNFEQLRNINPMSIRPEMKSYASRFQIWDYSQFNLDAWSQLNPKHKVICVPVGYAPILERISKLETQDIDVLIYGLTNEVRLSVFHALCAHGISAMYICGLYGKARDALIARSKIILNVSLYQSSGIFEIVRASYLMTNRKAVVAHIEEFTAVEPDIARGFKPSSKSTLVSDVLSLIQDDAKRRDLEDRGYEAIKKRNIKNILAAAITN